MEWQPWPRADERGLARYVTPLAKRWLNFDASAFDLRREGDGARKLIRAIYEALLRQDVSYALEEYHPSAHLQRIRTPADILTSASREGTCLDLATLFAGLCLGYELLPVLVVTQGHALVAVSVDRDLRSRPYHAGSQLFARSHVTLAESESWTAFRQMVDDGAYLAVECTGFAYSRALGAAAMEQAAPFAEAVNRRDGVLSFDDAVVAGREQLHDPRRPLAFALDVATAHYDWRIEPFVPIFEVIDYAKRQLPAVTRHIRDQDYRTLVASRTRGFVGRSFVIDGLDRLLADHARLPSGYVLIRGEPGVGKTALVAELVKRRGYLHHFNVVQENVTSAAAFLANACAQLIVRYDLPYSELPARATEDSGFLKTLLAEAASRTDGQRVVLLVDALDEAEPAGVSGGGRKTNRLLLPRELPENVVLVVTSREMVSFELVVERSEVIHLGDDDPRNLEDVRTYIRNFVEANRDMPAKVSEWADSVDAFIDVLSGKSQGNFMYLIYVLQDILAGKISRATIDDLDRLPTGLGEYYASHWDAMRHRDPQVFERLYRPVVCHLAVAREPVSLDQIAAWTQLSRADVLAVVETWRQFLNEEQRPAGHVYRIYHTSFQDFLAARVDLRPYDGNIADHIWKKIRWPEPPSSPDVGSA